MQENSAETLSALDWTEYACQRAETNLCTGPAAYILEIHALQSCGEFEFGPYGNKVEILCEKCTLELQEEVKEGIERYRMYGPLSCDGCRIPIENVSDILRSVLPLKRGETS